MRLTFGGGGKIALKSSPNVTVQLHIQLLSEGINPPLSETQSEKLLISTVKVTVLC